MLRGPPVPEKSAAFRSEMETTMYAAIRRLGRALRGLAVITLPALQNTRQVIEIDWSGGVPNATSTRFGLGRVTS